MQPVKVGSMASLLEKFVMGVAYGKQDASGCLPWGGQPNKSGYGSIGHDGTNLIVHRVAYELFTGPIPPGYQIDHLCRNRLCVEPTHLEAVTQQENMRRSAMNGGELWQPKCQDPAHHRRFHAGKVRCVECYRLKQNAAAARWREQNPEKARETQVRYRERKRAQKEGV